MAWKYVDHGGSSLGPEGRDTRGPGLSPGPTAAHYQRTVRKVGRATQDVGKPASDPSSARPHGVGRPLSVEGLSFQLLTGLLITPAWVRSPEGL